MKFEMEHENEDKNTTFSDAGLFTFLTQIHEFIDKRIAIGIKDSFEKGTPAKKLEVEIEIKINGEELDWDKLMEKYPEQIGFSYEGLAESIIEKAMKERAKRGK